MPIVISSPNERISALLKKHPAYERGELDVVDWDIKTPSPRESFDMLITPFMNGNPDFRFLDGVRVPFVQTATIGYEHVAPFLNDSQLLANAKTVHETATAELALALLLAVLRDIPRSVHSQIARQWDQFFAPGLADAHVLLIGYSGIGKAIAQRLEPFEVEVTRVAAHARDDEYGHVYEQADIPALLPDADAVILILPATPDSIGMVDDAFLSRMKDGAVLCNMARGTIADTNALIKHADRLRICFDVVDPEPLPADSPLYTHPNVLLTAHNGGYTQALWPRLERLLHRQIDHLLAGEQPENLVAY